MPDRCCSPAVRRTLDAVRDVAAAPYRARQRLARVALPGLLALLPVASAFAIQVDGRIDPDEWRDAVHVTDFRMVEPFTGADSPYPTEAWYMATPQGLAVGFRNRTPAGVEQPRQFSRRDEVPNIDRVNLMIDFNGDGQTGYSFMVTASGGIEDTIIGSGGTVWDSDWDGDWRHAVVDGQEQWSAELLIPWSIAPMPRAVDGKRTIGLYLDRVIGSTRERVAWPAATFTRPQFLKRFTAVQVPAHSQSLLAITPYAVAGHDLVHGSGHANAGADVFWKPSGQFQLSATLNPDFGQVESDQLVVNFGAEETFHGDKRPFFTENQALFHLRTPSDNSNLLYTRRVGGWADDDSGPGDISGALKLNGTVGATQYGVFLADERGDAGRSFGALRLLRGGEHATWGAMLTRVQRPWLDRKATVLGMDHEWKPDNSLGLSSRLIGSEIATAGQQVRDVAASAMLVKSLPKGWTHTLLLMHFGEDFEINDFGYLARNDLDYGQWEVRRQIDRLPETSAYASHDWRWRIEQASNTGGLLLQRQTRFSMSSRRRDGGELEWGARLRERGHDDLITRGHGPLRIAPQAVADIEREFPRRGNFSWEIGAEAVFGGGVRGWGQTGFAGWIGGTWHLSDAINIDAELVAVRDSEWLIWQQRNLVAGYRQAQLTLEGDLNWSISARQELRVKLQALGLQASDPIAWRVRPDGHADRTDDAIMPFGMRHFGFQVRYRYEFAPLSALYVVYGRGGDVLEHGDHRAGGLLGDAFALRDAEQLLVKLAYRFEL
ncbi:MAG: DUF5916 domain-containing protein [Pseudoxanthomonas suwonensis]|nr:DUF5916 domain-containing protein [Pseudoxanthomonas suwonensis]